MEVCGDELGLERRIEDEMVRDARTCDGKAQTSSDRVEGERQRSKSESETKIPAEGRAHQALMSHAPSVGATNHKARQKRHNPRTKTRALITSLILYIPKGKQVCTRPPAARARVCIPHADASSTSHRPNAASVLQ